LKVAEVYLADKMTPEKPKPAAPVIKHMKVDPAVLDTYVGKYELANGRIAILDREGEKLYGEFPGDKKIELIPESETRFFLSETWRSLTFERDKAGKVIGFTLSGEGETIQAKKFLPPVLNAEALAELCGDYHSPELKTTYSLSVKDGNLIAGHPRNPDTHLEPLDVDQFSGDNWWFRKIEFERDEEKKISGFILSGSRVRHLRFVKQ